MDFEEYMSTTGMDEQTENSCAWKFYKELYKVGQQSKQSEIDELRKRIDEALDHAVNHGGYDDLTHIINILNGDQS